MRYVLVLVAAIALSGCANSFQKVNCGWTNRVLPIKPSRKDKLTSGTSRQIMSANRAQERNCK